MLDCSTHFVDLAGGQEIHFNMQSINKSMYGKIKHTIRKGTEWATFSYLNQDQSMNVARIWKKKMKKWKPAPGQIYTNLKGAIRLKPTKFVHIFIAVTTFSPPPFFCADTFDTNLLLIVCALR